jgi:hypothetical protein
MRAKLDYLEEKRYHDYRALYELNWGLCLFYLDNCADLVDSDFFGVAVYCFLDREIKTCTREFLNGNPENNVNDLLDRLVEIESGIVDLAKKNE